jgi:hypothetical protein
MGGGDRASGVGEKAELRLALGACVSGRPPALLVKSASTTCSPNSRVTSAERQAQTDWPDEELGRSLGGQIDNAGRRFVSSDWPAPKHGLP